MHWIGIVVAIALIIIVLLDAFEVVMLPRRVRHGLRFARLYYRTSWTLGRAASKLIPAGRFRTGFLGAFGPLSLTVLIVLWAAVLISSFALLQMSLEMATSSLRHDFGTYLYFSGTTFFTLGYGDIVPIHGAGRALSVLEAGLGFVFLAAIVSYLPVLYQAFSRREITILLLDARAGSPPSAGELLRRAAEAGSIASLGPFLIEWERWSAELLESHLSFPVLSYYRSQHENQSWVGALTTILDTSALLIAGVEGPENYHARLAFAMARHAAGDLALVFETVPQPPASNRLSDVTAAELLAKLQNAGLSMRDPPAAIKALSEMRGLYEPFVNALATYFLIALPPFQPEKPPVDNWQTSRWMPRSPGLGGLASQGDGHFD